MALVVLNGLILGIFGVAAIFPFNQRQLNCIPALKRTCMLTTRNDKGPDYNSTLMYRMQRYQEIGCQHLKNLFMRNALRIIIFSTIIVSSCSKDHQLDNFKNQIAGKWEIEKNVCGECISPFTAYPEGNGHTIVLYKNGAFERRIHDSITFSGEFSLSKSEECGKSHFDISMSTNEISSEFPLFVTIESDKLQLSTPYCYTDGSITTFRRIQ